MAKVAYIISAAGASALFGFGLTVALAKKSDPTFFSQGLTGEKGIPESGGSLALRALGRGTLYSVGGFSLFCFCVWKLMGVQNMEEFRSKIQVMPAVPKNEPQGKSDFKTVKELIDYIIDEDKKNKNEKS